MIFIPSIDLINGKCVRLLHGDYTKETTYDADPIEVVKGYQDQGAQLIHVVDLDGAKSGVMSNLPTLEKVFAALSVPVQVGGGVRTLDTAKRLINAGATRVVMGTALVRDPEMASAVFKELGDGAVAGIDARGGKAAVAGWTDQSAVDALELALRVQKQGARRIVLTDIARDGAMTGPNTDFMKQFVQTLDIPVVASGGVTSIEDLLALQEAGAEGAIVGRALYDRKFDTREAVAALARG